MAADLPNQIVQFVGPGGTIAIVMGSFTAAGAYIDSMVRPDARDAFGKYLVSGDLASRVTRLPIGTRELFEYVFGRSHWSFKCIWRSAVFSMSSIVAVSVLGILHSQALRKDLFDLAFDAGPAASLDRAQFGLLLLAALMVDYLNLFKVRHLINYITGVRRTNLTISGMLVVADFVTYYILFYLIIALTTTLTFYVSGLVSFSELGMGLYLFAVSFPLGHALTWTDVLFFAGLVPSMWLWTSASAITLTVTAARSSALFRFARKILPFEQAPARSVGLMAGVMSCLAVEAMAVAGLWIKL